MSVPVDDGKCFACGPDNPIGLHLRFEYPDERHAVAHVTLDGVFQGWKGIAHGGIAMALLDEAMAHAAAASGHRGLTAGMSLRFRGPIPLGEPVELSGEVQWIRRNVLGLHAEVRCGDRVLLEGDGRFISKGSLGDLADRRVRTIGKE